MFNALPTRPSVLIPGSDFVEPVMPQFSDARTHGYQGPSRAVSIHNASSVGGGTLSRGPDRTRCVVAGRESLRILRISEPNTSTSEHEHKTATGIGGHRIEMSKNLWQGSGLKIESALTDVAWGHQTYDQKLITSSRNGELILWDLNKAGPVKYERRIKDHSRSINKLSYSHIHPYLCVTGSADGDLRVWDLRHLQKSAMFLRHPDVIRSVVVSPSSSCASHAVAALDNGSLFRWDIRVGQKAIERLPVAHTGAILGMDWCNAEGSPGGWLATAGLDRRVKVWDMSTGLEQNASVMSPNTGHSPMKALYTLRTQFPIRKVLWRPDCPTELAIASYSEAGIGGPSSSAASATLSESPMNNSPSKINHLAALSHIEESGTVKLSELSHPKGLDLKLYGDSIEIWDVRRAWIAKWAVEKGHSEGGVSDMMFGDSHALWAQQLSGTFSQMDLRFVEKPLENLNRIALSWDATNSLAHVTDRPSDWEVPYDDVDPDTAALYEERQIKKIGDSSFMPDSQAAGTSTIDIVSEDWHSFSALARGYRIEGASPPDVCGRNAQLAFDTFQYDAGNAWLLLQSLITEIPLVKPKLRNRPVPKRTISGFRSISSRVSQNRSLSKRSFSPDMCIEPNGHHSRHSRGRRPDRPAMALSASAHSSMNSIPYKYPNSTAMEMARSYVISKRPPNFLDSADDSVRRSSTIHSPAMSSRTFGDNQSDISKPIMGHGRLGERIMYDSDSSESPVSNRKSSALRETFHQLENAGPSEHSHRKWESRNLDAAYKEVADTLDNSQWSDEQNNDSVAWRSSDESSSDPSLSEQPALVTLRKNKPRRSSVGALPASIVHYREPISRHDSQSSMRTVTMEKQANNEKLLSKHHAQAKEANSHLSSKIQSPVTSLRNRNSGILSSALYQGSSRPAEEASANRFADFDVGDIRYLDYRSMFNTESEGRYSVDGWEILRQEFDDFFRSGNLQMSALLSCFAAPELHLKSWEATRLVEAYIEQLNRLRIFDAAAYLRKFYSSPEISLTSQLETTLQTVCSKCHKSVPKSSQQTLYVEGVEGNFLCQKCKCPLVTCSICHLPVKTLLFVCPVCAHGGHQECYRQYYMKRPMTKLAFTASNQRSSQDDPDSVVTANKSDIQSVLTVMAGHPCAAGCGHYCWAASILTAQV